jgi:hypothetical protein
VEQYRFYQLGYAHYKQNYESAIAQFNKIIGGKFCSAECVLSLGESYLNTDKTTSFECF